MRTALTITAVAVTCTFGALVASADAQDQSSSNGRLPKISSVTVSDINDQGQIVGSFGKSDDGSTRGFVWKRGSVQVLDHQGKFAGASEINERGQILGFDGEQEVLWENGQARTLGLDAAWDLNEAGQLLGGNLVAMPTGGYTHNFALWTNGTVQLLPFAPGTSAAMNNLGQVVGQMPNGDAAEWQNGTLTDLGPGFPIAINNHGDILGSLGRDVIMWHDGTRTDIGRGSPIALNEHGEALVSNGRWPFRALVWSKGNMTDLGTLGGRDTEATAISNSGQVVGSTTDSRGRQHGFVWQNGIMTRLPSPPGYKGARTRALTINDRNQIIGDNCLWDCGENRSIRHPSRFAVLWTLRGHKIETRRLVDIRR